jgi:hypothetical protein
MTQVPDSMHREFVREASCLSIFTLDRLGMRETEAELQCFQGALIRSRNDYVHFSISYMFNII